MSSSESQAKEAKSSPAGAHNQVVLAQSRQYLRSSVSFVSYVSKIFYKRSDSQDPYAVNVYATQQAYSRAALMVSTRLQSP